MTGETSGRRHAAPRSPRTPGAAFGSEAPGGEAPSARRTRAFYKELPLLIGTALLLALGTKAFLVQAFRIPSASMQNTLQEGDRVLVDKLTPWFDDQVRRGEVVVFRDPGGWLTDHRASESNPILRATQQALSFVGLAPAKDEGDLIKRVIAVGGDTVECTKRGPVKVNGAPLHEPYVYPGATPCGDDPVGTVKVPRGRIWAMGDHRNNSWDSRHRQLQQPGGGFMPLDHVIGRAVVIAWPVEHWAALSVPDTFRHGRLTARAAAVAPIAAGLLGALPLVRWNRNRRLRCSTSDAGTATATATATGPGAPAE
ncbi:signal peptidase I [Streptomyces sp. NPDC093589]|uniref:signal peptidase I n=1 Tax=Streptomyces sp. NPDC093589 TaxID=3366043 RepID=UPI00382BD9BD